MIIDPLAATLALCRADTTLALLVNSQIAEKHKFGMPSGGWPTPSKALQLAPDFGAEPDLSAGMQKLRLEARCYGDRPSEAMRVYRALVERTRTANRKVVATSNGNALVYWLLLDGSPRVEQDPDTHVDLVIVPLKAAVAEQSVP